MKYKYYLSKSLSILLLLICGCLNTTDNNDSTNDTDLMNKYIGAIYFKDESIQSWAEAYTDYFPGEECDKDWQTPEKALGKAEGDSYDIVSLGRGGSITMTFTSAIKNGPGPDFAVFENSFTDSFIELAYVEVSSDNENFIRYDNFSLTKEAVSEYGIMEFTNVYDEENNYTGYAGIHPQGYGTLFDLDDLISQENFNSSLFDIESIYYIRIVDIIGDGSYFDSNGNSIYDPYPTRKSAGFDLEALGVLH